MPLCNHCKSQFASREQFGYYQQYKEFNCCNNLDELDDLDDANNQHDTERENYSDDVFNHYEIIPRRKSRCWICRRWYYL